VEELQLLEQEMINVVLFHLDNYTNLTTAIETLTNVSYPLQLHNGYSCLLKLRLQAYIKEIRDWLKASQNQTLLFLTLFPMVVT